MSKRTLLDRLMYLVKAISSIIAKLTRQRNNYEANVARALQSMGLQEGPSQ